jgi:SAM-dependent methyltransferase
VEVLVAQTWDPAQYARHGAFVHGLAGGVLEWLAPQPGERILDLGCGDGQLTQRIAAAGAAVQGVDSSAEMVAAARERGIHADVASAELLPYPDSAFDAVFSNAALHWVRDHDAMMREVHRVLRRGGRFVAEMGGHGNVAAIRVAFMAVLARHGFGNCEDGVNYFPTPDGEDGMSGWLRTFRRGVLGALSPEARDTVVDETVALLANALRDEAGNWTGDYVRLRFIAIA